MSFDKKSWKAIEFFIQICWFCLLGIPLMSTKPLNTTSTPNRLSDLLNLSHSLNITSPQSRCIFPPRDIFKPDSPDRSLCLEMKVLEEGTLSSEISQVNNSLCFALMSSSVTLCAESGISTIQKIWGSKMNVEVLLQSNNNTTIESFCSKFEDNTIPHVPEEESIPEVDAFYKALFKKNTSSGGNQCIEVCKNSDSALKVNALCTLTNLGLEMIHSLKDIEPGQRSDNKSDKEVASNNTSSTTQTKTDLNVQTEVKKGEKGSTSTSQTGTSKESPSSNDEQQDVSPPQILSLVASNSSNSSQQSILPQPPLPGQDSDKEVKPVAVETVDQSNRKPSSSTSSPVKPISDSNNGETKNEGNKSAPKDDEKEKVNKEESKPVGVGPEKNTMEQPNDSSLNLPADGANQGLDTDSSEDMPPPEDPSLKNSEGDTNIQKPVLDQDKKNQIEAEDRVEKDNTIYPFAPDSEGDGSGYFGYFITFIGISCLLFVMFHNKKRLIALVVEGRRPRGGRRRSTGAAAYRKLENNFE